jgi:hypothetical protein
MSFSPSHTPSTHKIRLLERQIFFLKHQEEIAYHTFNAQLKSTKISLAALNCQLNMIVPLVNELSADTAMTSSAVVTLAHSKLLHHKPCRIELELQQIHGKLRTSLGEGYASRMQP